MLGIDEAGHAEYDPNASLPLIAPVSCPVPGRPAGAPRLFGSLKVQVLPDSLAFRIYRRHAVDEAFFCSFELNPAFQTAISAGGLRVSGLGEGGEARIVELPMHRFFLATLFLPQLADQVEGPHPVIAAYLEAALK
ncbi:MAG: hypothetical protein HY331_12785 [Chloroflexi bacterium]|nr:hypothetical protein [Chloroflexota bacterium]